MVFTITVKVYYPGLPPPSWAAPSPQPSFPAPLWQALAVWYCAVFICVCVGKVNSICFPVSYLISIL